MPEDEENEENDILNEFEEDILEEGSASRGKKGLIAALIIVVFCLIGGGGYYVYTTVLTSAPPPPLPVRRAKKKPKPPPPVQEAKIVEEQPGRQPAPEPVMERPETVETPVKETVVRPVVVQGKNIELAQEPVKEPPKPAATTVAGPGVKQGGRYTIQVGSYVYNKSLTSVKKRIVKLGLEPDIINRFADISTHHLFIGEFQDAEELKEIVNRLNNDGVQVTFKRLENGMYTLLAGSYFSGARAEEIKKDLILKGYPARVDIFVKKRKVHVLRTGHYSSRAEAVEVVNILKEKGINPLIIRRR